MQAIVLDALERNELWNGVYTGNQCMPRRKIMWGKLTNIEKYNTKMHDQDGYANYNQAQIVVERKIINPFISSVLAQSTVLSLLRVLSLSTQKRSVVSSRITGCNSCFMTYIMWCVTAEVVMSGIKHQMYDVMAALSVT